MENETSTIDISPKNMYVPICMVQAVCISVILIAIIIIKFVCDSGFDTLKNWCVENIFEKTEITANFEEGSDSEI